MYGAWAEMLSECRENFGGTPRQFPIWDRLNYLRISKPSWLRSNPSDRLNQLVSQSSQVFQDGVLVWGQVVQANQLLFEPGKVNCPALLLYAPDSELQMDPTLLEDVAMRSYELKGTQPREKDRIELAKQLTDETARPMGLQVPRSVCSIGSLVMSCTICVRHHFPKRHLRGNIFPLVRHKNDPSLILPLPGRYWAKRLIEWWEND